MRSGTRRKTLLAGLGLLTLGLPLLADSQYVIETAPGTNISVLASRYSLTVEKSYQSSGESSYSVSSAQPLSASSLKSLGSEPGVHRVESDAQVSASEKRRPASPRPLESVGNLLSTRTATTYYGARVLTTYVTQPGTTLIELTAAHKSFGGGAGIVAVIDTGVDPAHPALAGSIIPGYDFTRDRPDTYNELSDLSPAAASALAQSTVELLDAKSVVTSLSQSTVEILDQSTVEILDRIAALSYFGHGTMVAGLVHLVSPTARILPLKAFKSDGTASLFNIDRAIRYAADHGANVISMSFSYTTNSPVLQAAVDYARSKGAIAVASAGNDGKAIPVYPASYPYVIGVGSTNFSDRRSPFSNYGPAAKTSAPGEALVTLYPGGNYAAVWGTSFSTALVAGGIVDMLTLKPKMSYSYTREALDHGVQIDVDMGDARFDLLRSLTYCLRPGD